MAGSVAIHVLQYRTHQLGCRDRDDGHDKGSEDIHRKPLAWTETYRGAAAPWECDITEHFTLAFYFDRIAVAEANFAEKRGLIDLLRAGRFARRYDVRLVRELLAGSAFHVESAVIGDGDAVRIGHRVIDTQSGETATWFDVRWEAALRRACRSSRASTGKRPALDVRPEPKGPGRSGPPQHGGPGRPRRPRRISATVGDCRGWCTNSATRPCSSAARSA